MPPAAPKHLSYAEYLEQELAAAEKHEFVDGVLLAMAGGTAEHALVAMNLGAALHGALRGRPCRPYSSDLRIRIDARNASAYPDVSVICGEVQHGARDPHAAVNPTALFEVSSKTTAEYDRTVKFDLYDTLPSLQHYVIVSHRSQRVEVYSRARDGAWLLERFGAGETVPLPALDCSVQVDDIYEGTQVPAQDPELHRMDFLKEGLAEYGQGPAES